jgi:hypothetical protein
MDLPFDVIAIIGCLRRGSLTRRLVRSFDALAPASMKLEIVEIRDLTVYDQDAESDPPAPWVDSERIITYANHWSFWTCRRCNSRKRISDMPISCSMRPAH